jgi:phosphate starvation-inducible membrane PsiE
MLRCVLWVLLSYVVKNAVFCIILLYVAIFGNVTPATKENVLCFFIMYTFVAVVTKLRDVVGTNMHI